MAGKRVLMMTKVNAKWSSLEEFNKYWDAESEKIGKIQTELVKEAPKK